MSSSVDQLEGRGQVQVVRVFDSAKPPNKQNSGRASAAATDHDELLGLAAQPGYLNSSIS